MRSFSTSNGAFYKTQNSQNFGWKTRTISPIKTNAFYCWPLKSIDRSIDGAFDQSINNPHLLSMPTSSVLPKHAKMVVIQGKCACMFLTDLQTFFLLVTEKNAKTTNLDILHVCPRSHKRKFYVFHCSSLRSREQYTSYPIMGCTIIPLGLATSEEIKTFW